MQELKQLVRIHAPYIELLLDYLFNNFEKIPECRAKWMKFLNSISSTSPVCVLIPPTSEGRELINEISMIDVKANPEVCITNISKMYLNKL